MSWAKESAEVGLGGLTPEEAAVGALFSPDFQKMPDPLEKDPIIRVSTKYKVKFKYKFLIAITMS